MNLYVTTAELKTYLGISVSTYDSLLAMLNKQATAMINGILSASDLALHKVSAERHDAKGQTLYLHDPHVQAIGTIMDDTTEYTQDDAYDISGSTLHLADYLMQGDRKLTIDYAAGWNASGMATITVTDYSNIAAAATITLGAVNADGYTITRGTDWTAGTSNDTEAAAIATAIDSKAGTRSFAIKNVVYIIEDTNPQVNSRTLSTSDSTRLAKSAATLSTLDFPEDIRGSVMILVSSLYNGRKNPKLKSYSIGSKSVSFATESEFQMFKSMINPHMRVKITAI